MASLDVYHNRDARTAKSRPYVIDLQSTLLDDLPSTIIAPLAIPESIDRVRILRLNPDINIGVEDVSGLPWLEIDFPEDLIRAEQQVLPLIHER